MKKVLTALIMATVCAGPLFGIEYSGLKEAISLKYGGVVPKQWGENVEGVLTRFGTRENMIALTFDACGSRGDGFDSNLFEYLAKNNIPATFFISGMWIDRHPEEFKKLASNPLFEIENHGMEHRPASVNGNSVYGIKGTGSPAELVDEVELNAQKIEKLTGRKPKYYRSGTAYYDEVAVKIINELGYKIAGFGVLGDMGATYKQAQVKNALLSAKSGSIVILHINHPEKETGKGVMSALPALIKRQVKFSRLDAVGLH